METIYLWNERKKESKGAIACPNCGESHKRNLCTKEIKKSINCSRNNMV